MTPSDSRLRLFLNTLEQASQLASQTQITADALPGHLLALVAPVVAAQAGLCFTAASDLSDEALAPSGTYGDPPARDALERAIVTHPHAISQALHTERPALLPAATPHVQVCYMPLVAPPPLAGLLVLLVPSTLRADDEEMMVVRLIVERLLSAVEQQNALSEQHRLLLEAIDREQRLDALVDFISHISATLERTELITLIMGYAERLLNVEATSFWLLDETNNQLHLLVAAGDHCEQMSEISVQVGEGIIGQVVQSGQRRVVNDVGQEPCFNVQIDLQSGFETRSILTVPMRAPQIMRGDMGGEIHESIIGGAQALNKRNGQPFTRDDVRLFETLVRQAAIAFQLSQMFEEDHILFWGIVRATTGAIDLIDPYTHGHSERVSDYSVAIAEELHMSPAEIYRVRVGSMLHDVGKIGVDPQVLKKPGYLTEREMQEIRRHPGYGVDLFRGAGLSELLRDELLALEQHHERLDGSGYPYQLQGDQVSLIARVVAVADVFDALTSDRPYRAALPIAEVLEMLQHSAGTEFDAECVEALLRARARGLIKTQRERQQEHYTRAPASSAPAAPSSSVPPAPSHR
jgi:HD-GYP domain-containing protein (c-di-GMP phosphodiesterase class II)